MSRSRPAGSIALVRAWRKLRGTPWRQMMLVGSMLVSISILLVVLLAWQAPYGSRLLLEPREVASFNVVAPRRITYESAVLLERAQSALRKPFPTNMTPKKRSFVASRLTALARCLS